MEHKHTPGPWMAVGDYVFGGEDESFESVCLLKNTIYSNSKEANGRLIAVAPELLEALQELVACKRMKEQIAIQQELVIETDEEMEEMGRIMSDYARRQPKAWENASQIIAKATGEQE